jgi:putative ABC transport system substrate-binding protein
VIRRREFITILGVAGAAWPVGALGQQTASAVIGFLGASTAALASERVAAFSGRMGELGWIEGRNLLTVYRWTEGHPERTAPMIADLVQRQVNVIVTHGTANVIVAKAATSAIPIVFAVAADPIGSGLVASLAHPGGNATGLSLQAPDLAGKRVGLLREAVPALKRLAILLNVNNPANITEVQEVETAAQSVGVNVMLLKYSRADEIPSVFQTGAGHTDALYVCADPLVNTNRTRISTLALAAHWPMMLDNREFVAAGGFMSYGPNVADLFRRAADYVDKILRGEKAADLPVQQPTKFDLIVNLTTARALGITVPPMLLVRADEVIE